MNNIQETGTSLSTSDSDSEIRVTSLGSQINIFLSFPMNLKINFKLDLFPTQFTYRDFIERLYLSASAASKISFREFPEYSQSNYIHEITENRFVFTLWSLFLYLSFSRHNFTDFGTRELIIHCPSQFSQSEVTKMIFSCFTFLSLFHSIFLYFPDLLIDKLTLGKSCQINLRHHFSPVSLLVIDPDEWQTRQREISFVTWVIQSQLIFATTDRQRNARSARVRNVRDPRVFINRNPWAIRRNKGSLLNTFDVKNYAINAIKFCPLFNKQNSNNKSQDLIL